MIGCRYLTLRTKAAIKRYKDTLKIHKYLPTFNNVNFNLDCRMQVQHSYLPHTDVMKSKKLNL